MTVGLAVGITAAVASACGVAAYVYSAPSFPGLLDTARATALGEGELIRAALEHQMMENDRSLIARMIESFGRQPGIERVLLLDRRRHRPLRRAGRRARRASSTSARRPARRATASRPRSADRARVIETRERHGAAHRDPDPQPRSPASGATTRRTASTAS